MVAVNSFLCLKLIDVAECLPYIDNVGILCVRVRLHPFTILVRMRRGVLLNQRFEEHNTKMASYRLAVLLMNHTLIS